MAQDKKTTTKKTTKTSQNEDQPESGLFDIAVANKLYDPENIRACRDYVKKFFYPLHERGHIFVKNGRFVFIETADVKGTYFNRLPKDISAWYFTKHDKLYSLISDVNKPRIDGNNLNMCAGFKWKNPKPYASFPEETKAKVEKILSYIKEIIASNVQKAYIYILKWNSNVCKGKKNDACIYLKGPEGIGKSAFIEFFMEFVFGLTACVKPGTECLTSNYNKILCGKPVVLFEEMPVFSATQWDAAWCKLKDMITGRTLAFRDVYEKTFEADNINNYIINTNLAIVKGRRIYEADVCTKRWEDHAYFSALKAECFNDETGEAMFSYLFEYDTTGFNAQADMPDTRSKLRTIADRLEPPHIFIKEVYVLKHRGIHCKPAVLHSTYRTFCEEKGYEVLSTHKLYAKLLEVQIDYRKIGGVNVFKYSKEDLLQIANKRKWIHELDEFVQDEQKPIEKDGNLFVDEKKAGSDALGENENEIDPLDQNIDPVEPKKVSKKEAEKAIEKEAVKEAARKKKVEPDEDVIEIIKPKIRKIKRAEYDERIVEEVEASDDRGFSDYL
jgi:hypothetical protein